MKHKAKSKEAKQISEDSHSAPLESEKIQHKKTGISESSDNIDNFTGNTSKHAGLSEKFFLSDFTEE
jgi:hypothetical protein